MSRSRAWEEEEGAVRSGPPFGRWWPVYALSLGAGLLVMAWPILGRERSLTAVVLLAAAAPFVAALVLQRSMPGLSRVEALFALCAVFGAAVVAVLLAADAHGRLLELKYVRKDHPRRIYWAASMMVAVSIGWFVLMRPLTRLEERRAVRGERRKPPPLPVRLALGLLGAPLAASALIGTAEGVRWVRSVTTGDHVLIGFWYYGTLVLMPYMLQRQIVRRAASGPGRSFWLEAMTDYLGTLTGCIVLFTYFSRAQYLASSAYYAGADGPALGTWLFYCLNSFFDAVLLGAPSMFGFEISAVAPRTFSARMMLYVFRLLTVAALLQTFRMIVKVRAGESVKLDELGLIARHIPD